MNELATVPEALKELAQVKESILKLENYFNRLQGALSLLGVMAPPALKPTREHPKAPPGESAADRVLEILSKAPGPMKVSAIAQDFEIQGFKAPLGGDIKTSVANAVSYLYRVKEFLDRDPNGFYSLKSKNLPKQSAVTEARA